MSILNVSDDLIINAKKGDSTSLSEVIKNCDGFIKSFIRESFELSPLQQEEVYNSAILGLLRGLNRFDVTKGFRLTTFARKFIFREVLDFLSKDGCHSKIVCRNKKGQIIGEFSLSSIDQPLSEGLFLKDTLGVYDKGLLASEDSLFIDQLLGTLPKKHSEVITDIYFNDKLVSQIASERNLSNSTIHSYRRVAFDAIRKEVPVC